MDIMQIITICKTSSIDTIFVTNPNPILIDHHYHRYLPGIILKGHNSFGPEFILILDIQGNMNVYNTDNNNMPAIMAGYSKMSSIDTVSDTNITHLTNGVLSELEDSILDDDYNYDLENLLQDIYQIEFTEKYDDDEDDDDQKQSEECELIENRKDSES